MAWSARRCPLKAWRTGASPGRTREDARENVIDALRLMLTPDDDDPATANGSSEPLSISFAA